MKIIDIITTANANMFRSKLRTSLTIVAIFIGSFTLALTSGLGSGISSYLDKQLNSLGAKDVLVVMAKNTSSGVPSDKPKPYDPSKQTSSIASEGNRSVVLLTNADITKIKQVPGIKSVEPYLSASVAYVTGSNGDKFVASVTQYVSGANYPLEAGSLPDNSAASPQVLLPTTYVEPLGFSGAQDAIGKTVQFGVANPAGQISEISGTIVGVGQKSLLTGSGIQVNTNLNSKLYAVQIEGLPPAASSNYQVVVAKFDPKLTDAEITKLKSELDKLGYTGQTVKDQIGILKTVISAIVTVLNGFAIIALLAAGFGIINTLLMSVQERTKEIGLMKAMGMSSSRIFLLFSSEAVMLGFWGSLLGVGVAVIVGSIINKIVMGSFLKDLVGLKLLTFPPLSILMIMGIVMIIAFLAGTLPAIRAARQSPIDSLRYE